jgi:polyhydroxyalkanoate synthesis regulator protein
MLNLIKYKNRKLYGNKRYYTIKDLLKIVLNGKYINVHDAITKKDITNKILLQILTELKIEDKSEKTKKFLYNSIRQ